jgi:acetyl esterase/lipase
MPSASLSRPFLLAAALLTAGCESVLFRYVNRAVPPADDSVVYAADRALALDVYRPRNASATAPTVVFFYGGAWKRGDRSQYAFVGHRLAGQGILAVVADYRTYPRTTFPGFMRDAADAVAWVRLNAARYGGDPQRLFVAGHSAGAQIAALLGTDARHLHGVGLRPRQLAGVIGLSGPYDFEVGSEYAEVFGPPSQWPQAQAVNFVDGDEPPFLLVHGSSDRVVEARDSSQLHARLSAAGTPSTLLLLEGAGHGAPLAGLYEPGRSPRVVPAIVDFVRAR